MTHWTAVRILNHKGTETQRTVSSREGLRNHYLNSSVPLCLCGLKRSCRNRPHGLTLVELIVIIALAALLVAVLWPAIVKSQQEMRRMSCFRNAKTVGLAIHLYSMEHEGMFPPVSSGPMARNLVPDGRRLFPRYIDDLSNFLCPLDPRAVPDAFKITDENAHPAGVEPIRDDLRKGSYDPDCLAPVSYIYLGWAMQNDRELNAGMAAYLRLWSQTGNQFPYHVDTDVSLRVPDGQGNDGGRYIHRIRERLGRGPADPSQPLYDDEMVRSRTPMLMDIPSANPKNLSHYPPGCNVLFADGHLEFFPFAERFPLNQRVSRDAQPQEGFSAFPMTLSEMMDSPLFSIEDGTFEAFVVHEKLESQPPGVRCGKTNSRM